MLNSSRRGKRDPASSWRLGTTRTIKVPIVLANVLLKLARQIDNGQVTLVDDVLTLDEQEDHTNIVSSDDEKYH